MSTVKIDWESVYGIVEKIAPEVQAELDRRFSDLKEVSPRVLLNNFPPRLEVYLWPKGLSINHEVDPFVDSNRREITQQKDRIAKDIADVADKFGLSANSGIRTRHPVTRERRTDYSLGKYTLSPQYQKSPSEVVA